MHQVMLSHDNITWTAEVHARAMRCDVCMITLITAMVSVIIIIIIIVIIIIVIIIIYCYATQIPISRALPDVASLTSAQSSHAHTPLDGESLLHADRSRAHGFVPATVAHRGSPLTHSLE